MSEVHTFSYQYTPDQLAIHDDRSLIAVYYWLLEVDAEGNEPRTQSVRAEIDRRGISDRQETEHYQAIFGRPEGDGDFVDPPGLTYDPVS